MPDVVVKKTRILPGLFFFKFSWILVGSVTFYVKTTVHCSSDSANYPFPYLLCVCENEPELVFVDLL
jgi:hypothetical protein